MWESGSCTVQPAPKGTKEAAIQMHATNCTSQVAFACCKMVCTDTGPKAYSCAGIDLKCSQRPLYVAPTNAYAWVGATCMAVLLLPHAIYCAVASVLNLRLLIA